MNQPKPIAAYYMEEPRRFNPNKDDNSWGWHVTVDDDLLIDAMYSVEGAEILDMPHGKYLVFIDWRYDYQDVWLAMDDALAEAARALEVAETWGGAVDAALGAGD